MTPESAILGIVVCLVGIALTRIFGDFVDRPRQNTAAEEAAARVEAERLARAGETAEGVAKSLERGNANQDRRSRLDDLGGGL